MTNQQSPKAPKGLSGATKAWLAASRAGVAALAIAVALAASAPSPVAAQDRLEVSIFGGYTFSEGINVSPGTALGETIDRIDPTDGAGFAGAINFWVNQQTQVGFQFGLQSSGLEVSGASHAREVASMTLNNYHGTVTFHAGSSASQVRPFFMFGLGATQFLPGDMLVGTTTDDDRFDSETKFSGTLGAGVKFYVSEKVGLGVTARWTPTYIKSDPAGLYCSPYWSPWYPGGCAVMSDADYANQYELSGGLIFRF